MEDLWRRSATDIAALVQSKKISATEAASAALARLDAVNPSINAVVDHRPEDVLAQAGAIDAALRRNESVGPLAGVPVTIKVNIDQQGFATTNGLKLQRDLIARSNSPVVDNLRKAGAVILGRTNCPAFSYRWFTTNLIHGDTRNPRDPGLTPGGSSGGAGAAVAAGIGPIAHGTDIAGSIRYPAYACGVHGLRPTVGRIAAFNAVVARTHHRPADQRGIGSAGAHHRRSADRARGDVRPRTRAIPGGCPPRSKALNCRSGRRCAFARTVWRPSPRWRRRLPMRRSACSAPDGWWRKSRPRRRCAKPRSCRPNCGSATVMKRNWRPPSAKATPAHSPACAATGTRSFRSMRQRSPKP